MYLGVDYYPEHWEKERWPAPNDFVCEIEHSYDVISITPPGKYYPLYTNRKIYKKAPKKIGDYHRIQDEFRW